MAHRNRAVPLTLVPSIVNWASKPITHSVTPAMPINDRTAEAMKPL